MNQREDESVFKHFKNSSEMDDSLNALEYYKSVSKTNRIARNSLGVQANRSIKSPIPGFSPLVTDKKSQYHTTT